MSNILLYAGVALLLAVPIVWLFTRSRVRAKPAIKAGQKYLCFVVYPSVMGGIVEEKLSFKEPPGNPYRHKGNLVYLLVYKLDKTGNGVYEYYEPLAEIPMGMPPEKLFRGNRCEPAVRLLQWQSRFMEKVAVGSLVGMGVAGMVVVFFILSELGKGKM